MIVVDASVVLAWAYREKDLDAAKGILLRLAGEGGAAPAIWPMEIANSLEISMRKERISPFQGDELLAAILDLGVQIESLSTDRIYGDVARLARRHALTIYDAQYLETALRLRLPLATLDDELIAAAHAEGVVVLP